MTLLILYEELAAYFITCISSLIEHNQPINVYIIRKEINTHAPFKFNLTNVTVYNRAEHTDTELILLAKRINPDAIFCGGWASKIYLKIIAQHKKKIPTILGFDNIWEGTVKQNLACLIAPFYITNIFNKCFVPGIEQQKFALKMGFKKNQIAIGAYSCDYHFFNKQYLINKEIKQNCFPKRFIYVGRYLKHKGIEDLWKAFIDLQNDAPSAWELWCIGTGDVEPVIHNKIKHMGFVQPSDLKEYISKTGVFVLPSHFEPWGVVIHEFAAAGFPIICSDKVGARTTFVEENVNGYIYKAGNINELKAVLKKMMSLSDHQVFLMAEQSAIKAEQITPETWAHQLMTLVK